VKILIRKMLEDITGKITDEEFKCAMDLTTQDIKANRLFWGKHTDLNTVIKIASQSVNMLRRCN